MKIFFTALFILFSFQFAFGQRLTYREAVRLHKQDRYFNAGTVYGIFVSPVGPYRASHGNRGFGVGTENRISLFKTGATYTPVYNINTTINRWNSNGSIGTDIMLSGQAGLNYNFPTQSETLKTYVQALLGVGAAGSYLSRNRGYQEEINHQGVGLLATLGTGIYFNRFNFGITGNFFNPKLTNETTVQKNMSTVYVRVGVRL